MSARKTPAQIVYEAWVRSKESSVSGGVFVCLWCFAVSDDPAVYRHPLDALGGYDADTGEPLCEGCVDAAREDTP